MDRCTVIINFSDGRDSEDLDIPLDISAMDLLLGLNEAYKLGYDLSRINEYSLRAENPICLLKGTRSLQSYGLRHGSQINIMTEDENERRI